MVTVNRVLTATTPTPQDVTRACNCTQRAKKPTNKVPKMPALEVCMVTATSCTHPRRDGARTENRDTPTRRAGLKGNLLSANAQECTMPEPHKDITNNQQLDRRQTHNGLRQWHTHTQTLCHTCLPFTMAPGQKHNRRRTSFVPR